MHNLPSELILLAHPVHESDFYPSLSRKTLTSGNLHFLEVHFPVYHGRQAEDLALLVQAVLSSEYTQINTGYLHSLYSFITPHSPIIT